MQYKCLSKQKKLFIKACCTNSSALAANRYNVYANRLNPMKAENKLNRWE